MARIAGVNIPTNKRVTISLRYIYGIGPTNSRAILKEAAIDPQRLGSQVGTLSFNELRAVDAALLTVLGLAF